MSSILPENLYNLITKNGRNDLKFQVNIYDQQNKAKDCLCTINLLLSTVNSHEVKAEDSSLKAENSINGLKSCFDKL